MKYRFTVLNIIATLYLLYCFGELIFNYRALSSGEGWGVVAMFGLIGIGIAATIIDLILQQIIKNKIALNIIGGCVAIGGALSIFYG